MCAYKSFALIINWYNAGIMGQKLGQHFLQDESVVEDIVSAGKASGGDTVLEIGPGKGVLTRKLLKAGAEVIAVEKDPGLASKLENKFASAIETDQLQIINEDVRDTDRKDVPESYKVVANIPYYLTSELIRSLLTADNKPKRIVLLIQKEVAERITNENKPFDATQGKESILSLSVKAYGQPEYIQTVPAEAFHPPPNVDSAILRIKDISDRFFQENDIDNQQFFRFVKSGFSHKRKQLKNNLDREYPAVNIPQTLQSCGLQPTIRAEELTISDWQCLYSSLEDA